MNVPEKITMTPSVFGDGRKGYALQQTRNDEYGVQCDAVRERHGAPWLESWTSDYLPEQVFRSFRELHAAVTAAAMSERRPIEIIEVIAQRPGSGGCWLCDGDHAYTVRAKTCWRAGDLSLIRSCDAHLEEIKADPAAAIAARRRRVAERRAAGRKDAIECLARMLLRSN